MRNILTPLIACTLAAALTACNSTPTDDRPTPNNPTPTRPTIPDQYRVPDKLRNSTIIWSAEPGIDLLGTEGTLTRAALEANEITLTSSVTDSYPGFERVIDEETKGQYLEFPPTNNVEVGTAYFHIMRIEPTPTGFVAHTCRQVSNVAVKKTDGRYSRSVTTGDFNPKFVFEHTNALSTPTQSTTPTATPPVGDTGQPQWQAPTYDVFTGWTIDIDGTSGYAHTQACRHWGHQYAPDAIPDDYFILTTDTPPDTLPAYPGW